VRGLSRKRASAFAASRVRRPAPASAPWHPPLSTDSDDAAAHYLEGLHRYLSILPAAPRSFDNAVRADPTFAVGAAALAVTAMGVGERELAMRSLASARAAARDDPDLPAMSRSHIGAVDAFLTGPAPRALGIAGTHLRAHPGDVFVLALTMGALHTNNRVTRRQEALGLLDDALAAGVDHFAVPSLRSFVVADLGDLDRARADAESGLAANARSAHAAHGMAHVFYETAQHEAGRDWLTAWTADFDPRASGLHLSWHLALHDLALGDLDRLERRYETSIRPHAGPTLFIDAVDILWRSRLAGADDPARWSSLRTIVPAVAEVRTTSLALIASIVVLAGSGDTTGLGAAIAWLRTLRRNPLCREVILPIAEALLAIAQGDIARAARQLEGVGDELVAVSASNAQLDLLSCTLRWCEERLAVECSSFLGARLQPGSPARSMTSPAR